MAGAMIDPKAEADEDLKGFLEFRDALTQERNRRFTMGFARERGTEESDAVLLPNWMIDAMDLVVLIQPRLLYSIRKNDRDNLLGSNEYRTIAGCERVVVPHLDRAYRFLWQPK